jgi:hypothetical protein
LHEIPVHLKVPFQATKDSEELLVFFCLSLAHMARYFIGYGSDVVSGGKQVKLDWNTGNSDRIFVVFLSSSISIPELINTKNPDYNVR